MRSGFSKKMTMLRALTGFGFAVALSGALAHAQDAGAGTSMDTSSTGWQRYDWLKSADEQQKQAASGTTIQVKAGQDVQDPYTVLSTGALWQEKYDAVYTKRLADSLTLSCDTSEVTLTDGSSDVSQGQQAGFQFTPDETLTLGGNFHHSAVDDAPPENAWASSGAGLTAQGHLPFNSVLTLDMNSDRSGTEVSSSPTTTDTTYNAQLQKPLGSLPLSAVFKGHYEEIATTGAPTSKLPTLEQSLLWKPMEDTSVQAGLRQQQYQAFPGDSNALNEAIFADLSQKVASDLTWHSYAEVLGSRTTDDAAPVAPIASGANGTPQASAPKSALAMPTLDDTSLTFSTGPSFQLQKDISASVEYSNRWDTNPVPGSTGTEQRLSISVKGTF